MDKFLLLGLPVLLCCFRVLCGSFADQEHETLGHFFQQDGAGVGTDFEPDGKIQAAVAKAKDPCVKSTVDELSVDDRHLPEIIQCRTCHIQFPRQKCSRGRGLCIAMKEEACTTGKIFKNDGTLWLTFRGCLKNCANVNNIKWSVYLVNFRCCRSHDLCNEDI